jgi:hypothetical protein
LAVHLPYNKVVNLGKVHIHAPASTTTSCPIDADDLQPSNKGSSDQIESSTPGFLDVYRGQLTSA